MRLAVWAILVMVIFSCAKEQKQLIVKTGGAEKSIRLSELKNRFGDTTIEIDDYYLHRKVHYRAISLPALLNALAAEAGTFDEFVFRCADGYLAHVSRADFDAGKLANFYLAYGESTRGAQPGAATDGIGASGESTGSARPGAATDGIGASGENGDYFSSKIIQGKAEISPEPFYAVATEKASFRTLSWPYEIVAIELVDFKKTFPALFVAGMDQNASAGFQLFRQECVKCHSLNLQGGDIGPELNVPRNITEYRDEAFLKSFIRNASAYRAKSKMQSFAHLSDAQIGQIIAYLKVMRLHKTRQP